METSELTGPALDWAVIKGLSPQAFNNKPSITGIVKKYPYSTDGGTEMKPHVHQKLIIEWANGAKIQYRYDKNYEWYETTSPSFNPDHEYRVKPKIITYRVALYVEGRVHISTNPGSAYTWEADPGFIKWLTPWLTEELC